MERKKPMSSKQFLTEMNQAMKDSKFGRMIKATDLKTKIQKWD